MKKTIKVYEIILKVEGTWQGSGHFSDTLENAKKRFHRMSLSSLENVALDKNVFRVITVSK